MKQFITNIKNLSQKAAEIKAAMQQIPPKGFVSQLAKSSILGVRSRALLSTSFVQLRWRVES